MHSFFGLLPRRRRMANLALVLISILFAGCKKNEQTHCLQIFGVYPAWNTSDKEIESIAWDRFTHLAITFIIPNPDGSLNTNAVDRTIEKIVSNEKAKDKKIYVSIGGASGYGDAFQVITSDPSLQEKFVQEIVAYAKKHNLDGVDIDWEYWTKQDVKSEPGNDPIESRQLVGLLAELREELPVNVDLSVSVFPGYWKGEQYLVDIQGHVNYIILMAYDATGAWSSSSISHHADFSIFKNSSKFLLKRGFVKEKIILAVPMYGIEFMDGKNKSIKHHSFREVERIAADNNENIDRGKIGNIFYETPSLVKKKSQYILDGGFAGILFFELTQDSLASEKSLLSASNKIISPSFCKE